MKYELIKKVNKEEIIIFTTTEEKEIIKKLLYELWITKVEKAKFKRLQYKYNYSDIQTIKIIDNSMEKQQNVNIKYIHKFSEIKTKCGLLDTDKILNNTDN